VPTTSLVTIVAALAFAGIFGVNGIKFTLAPASFPDGPNRLKKLRYVPGSVWSAFM